MVWAHVMAQLGETGRDGQTNHENWSRTILGRHYVPTRPQELRQLLRSRYPEEAEAIQLVSLVGLDNVLAAFFGGERWRVTRAIPGSFGTLPASHAEPGLPPSAAPS